MDIDDVGLGAEIGDAEGDFDSFDEVIELFNLEDLEEIEIKRLKTEFEAAQKRLAWATMAKEEKQKLILDLIQTTGEKVKK